MWPLEVEPWFHSWYREDRVGYRSFKSHHNYRNNYDINFIYFSCFILWESRFLITTRTMTTVRRPRRARINKVPTTPPIMEEESERKGKEVITLYNYSY